jgi:hypothetical protein
MRSSVVSPPSLTLIALAAAVALAGACANSPTTTGNGGAGNGAAGTTGTAGATGTAGSGAAGTTSTAGATGTGDAGATGTAGTGGTSVGGSGGNSGMSGPAGAGGTSHGGNSGMSGTAGAGSAGTTGTAGSGGTTGGSGADDPPLRAINVTAGGGCNCNINAAGGKATVDTRKPIQGKLVITLPGICGGPGGGGLEGTAIALGYHVFQPQTQSCVNGGDANHQKYKDMLADKDPSNDAEANRMVGDARMELWDGVDRVPFVTVAKGQSIAEETEAAIKAGMAQDPGGDWGYFLNAQGHPRWSDVFLMGYSWGAQSAAMIASYVRFGRVFCASGPQAEGFPNAAWITHGYVTPPDRLFMTVGFNEPYPSMDKTDIAPNTVNSMVDTVLKAGWTGPPTNVLPGDLGPYSGRHIFTAVAKFPYTQHAPGGHGIYCNNDPMSGWKAMCDYIFSTSK